MQLKIGKILLFQWNKIEYIKGKDYSLVRYSMLGNQWEKKFKEVKE